MNKKLIDLNNYLFKQLERLNEVELVDEKMETEIERAKAITDCAQTIINNGELLLKAQKHYDEYGIKYKIDDNFLLGK